MPFRKSGSDAMPIGPFSFFGSKGRMLLKRPNAKIVPSWFVTCLLLFAACAGNNASTFSVDTWVVGVALWITAVFEGRKIKNVVRAEMD